ncbi:potassium/sodium hyperpolarization-activated cyclic nucleotide-gated channel 2-like [Sander lucioperca]|uniref:potassium/sodium hyperpolarization-activated cyclic nucleotide-gated channel 2-like n=1 Tax=Sander lucioperca TaxID=283035 RepID=UPI001653E319|nr:potassium/sodium hyperpolarization-activated cyclic nucleotide-gated channel 2-like [Sander lucioperca]
MQTFANKCRTFCSYFVFSVCVAGMCMVCSAGKDRNRWRDRERGGGGFKMSSRKTTSKPIPPSPSPPPLPPPRPPLRSRRKSKSPSSRSNHSTPKRALDLDKIGTTIAEDSRQTGRGSQDLRGSQGSELDRKWEGVALELHCRGSRMRSAVYQTSDLPSMVKAKRQLEQSEGKGQIDRSKWKATFV